MKRYVEYCTKAGQKSCSKSVLNNNLKHCLNDHLKCYFFGTFNPPHIGHLRMAKAIYDKYNSPLSFEKIVFVPNYKPCHKILNIKPTDRLNMLKLLPLDDWGEVSDVEFHLPEPSYTYRTINSLYKGTKIPFIIGYDAFVDIEKWKNPDILKEKLTFIVLQRNCDASRKDIEALKVRGWDFKIEDDIGFEKVSSRVVRKQTAEGKAIENMVTKEVEKYIYENKLYKKMA